MSVQSRTARRFLALAATLFLTAAAVAAPADKPAAKPATTNAPALPLAAGAIPQSTFGMPTKPQDGHDPFFPVSERMFLVKTAPKSAATISSPIVLNGISGSPEHRFAMINGHTLAEGEQAPVNTTGGRVIVRCLEIKGESVVVEIAGERRELHFQGH